VGADASVWTNQFAMGTGAEGFRRMMFISGHDENGDSWGMSCAAPNNVIVVDGTRYMFELTAHEIKPVNPNYSYRKTMWPRKVLKAIRAWHLQGKRYRNSPVKDGPLKSVDEYIRRKIWVPLHGECLYFLELNHAQNH